MGRRRAFGAAVLSAGFKRHPPPDELADLPFVYGAARAAADTEETAPDVTLAVITVALLTRRSGQVAERRRREAIALVGRRPRGGRLEASRQMAVVEVDPAELPERSTDEWERGLDEAQTRGLNALWYSRFAVGPEHDAYEGVLAFARAWEACFRGRPVVTLCPYVVGAVDAGRALERLTTLTEIHDAVLVPVPTAGPRSAPRSHWIEGRTAVGRPEGAPNSGQPPEAHLGPESAV